jgi:hypothetical protein
VKAGFPTSTWGNYVLLAAVSIPRYANYGFADSPMAATILQIYSFFSSSLEESGIEQYIRSALRKDLGRVIMWVDSC